MDRSFPRAVAQLFFLLALVLAGCSKQASDPSTSTTADGTNKPPHKITFIHDWYPEAEHGGYFAAKVKGIWQELGLDVKMVAGGPNSEIEKRVALDEASAGDIVSIAGLPEATARSNAGANSALRSTVSPWPPKARA